MTTTKPKVLIVGNVDPVYITRLEEAGYEVCHDPLDNTLRGVGFDSCWIDEKINSTAAWELNRANDYLCPLGRIQRYPQLQETVDKPKKLRKIPKQKQDKPFWVNDWRD